MKKIAIFTIMFSIISLQAVFAEDYSDVLENSSKEVINTKKNIKTIKRKAPKKDGSTELEVPEDYDEDLKGYEGTLPDLEEHFRPFQKKDDMPLFEYENGFNDLNEMKPIPRDNPAFINIIMKKDKSSQYLNDLNEIIGIIEKLEKVVEKHEDIQVFNAKAYYLGISVDYFRDKYKNKPEATFSSFKALMQLNTQVQTIFKLRQEKEEYSPYVTAASSGNMFSDNNIELQLEYLLDNIKKTLIILKETR